MSLVAELVMIVRRCDGILDLWRSRFLSWWRLLWFSYVVCVWLSEEKNSISLIKEKVGLWDQLFCFIVFGEIIKKTSKNFLEAFWIVSLPLIFLALFCNEREVHWQLLLAWMLQLLLRALCGLWGFRCKSWWLIVLR